MNDTEKKELNEEAKEAKIELYTNKINNFFEDHEREWKRTKTNFVTKINKTEFDFEYVLKCQTEEIIKAQETYSLISGLKRAFENIEFKENTIHWYKEALCLTDTVLDDLKDSLIRSPYRHDSTCIMTNAFSAWKIEKKADLVSDRFITSLKTINQILNTLCGLLEDD